MKKEHQNLIDCSTFEELLSGYLDKTLDAPAYKAVAAHALSCPLCHSLLNDVKESLRICQQITVPSSPITRLEARVLSMTLPETAMSCEEFESCLTDYLDGFLTASTFHRWERHASLCTSCEDLPGMVVRSVAACYTYKMDELALPPGLYERILKSTLGTERADSVKASLSARAREWIRGLRFPIGVPQLAPVATLLFIAFLIFSQTVSADGSLAGVYQTGYELAEATYKQSAEAINGTSILTEPTNQEPVSGTTFVNSEGENK